MRNEVMVYVVAGGWQYEGEDLASVQVFRNREDAVQHGEFVKNDQGYDYYVVQEVEVG